MRAIVLVLATLSALPETASSQSGRPLVRQRQRTRIRVPGHELDWSFGTIGGFLGVEAQSIGPELREHFGAPRSAGVLVARVEDDSSAAEAGIRVGDVIVSVDGDEIDDPWDLWTVIGRHRDGDEVDVVLVRERRRRTVRAKVEGAASFEFDLPDLKLWESDIRDFFREGSDAIERIEREIDRLRERLERLERRRR